MGAFVLGFLGLALVTVVGCGAAWLCAYLIAETRIQFKRARQVDQRGRV